MTMSKRHLYVFLSTLLAATWVLQIGTLAIGIDPSSPEAAPYLIAAMFMPAVWSLAYLLLFNRKAWRFVRFWPGNPLWLVLAALIPTAIAMIVTGLMVGSGLAQSSFFGFSGEQPEVLRGPWEFGLGQQSWLHFAFNIAVTGCVFAAINSTVAVGEEFGWRGVVQHHLIARYGTVAGIVILGLAWGFWHLPMNLAGYNHGEAPLLGALVLFPITLVANSFVMGWLTLRARSFWPAVVYHGSVNGLFAGVTSDLTPVEGVSQLTGEWVMLAVQCLAGLIALWLLIRDREKLVPTHAATPSPSAS